MEGRIKSLASIEEKIERKGLTLESVTALDDLIGVRAILLFRKDLKVTDELISKTFYVLHKEDTSTRLADDSFGYQSQHYVVQRPKSWGKIPSFSELGTLRVELQVRTLAQHIWASASHKLQYNQENSVPPPLRRAISRVSALLETVDLEIDRVLDKREIYIRDEVTGQNSNERLNVESLASVLAECLPPENRTEAESYGNLFEDLLSLTVTNVSQLRELLAKHKEHIDDAEAKQVAQHRKRNDYAGSTQERITAGVFYAHVGLARAALRAEFGSSAVNAL
jgi:ppGpp synthetase/RelA/SpoT-type nucleotidyltranferase